MKKKTLFSTALVVGAVGVSGMFAVSRVMAADVIGEVTGKDGDVKELLSVDATVTAVDGSQVSFVDSDTGEEYGSSFGPGWFSDEYEVGDEVTVVGVETETENNDRGHDFQVMEVDETVLREEFEGRPAWAGQGGRNGNGEGNGQSRQMRHNGSGEGFVDTDGDGVCDNSI